MVHTISLKIFKEIKTEFSKNRKQLLIHFLNMLVEIYYFQGNFKEVKGNFKNIDTISILQSIDIIDIHRYS